MLWAVFFFTLKKQKSYACRVFSVFFISLLLLVSLFFIVILQGDDLHVSCYYIDCNLNAFAISSAQVSIMYVSQNHAAWALFLLNYRFSLSGFVNRDVRNYDLNKAKFIYNDQLGDRKFEQVTVSMLN